MSIQLDEKAGRRVRKPMVDLMKEIVNNARAVLAFAEYRDIDEQDVEVELEVEEKADSDGPKATIGDIERSRGQLVRAPAGRAGGANWSAKVGQIIIGNLMRGEGGRFASARNIGKMMRTLDDVGITPDMFIGMQSLLAGDGASVSGGIMADLRSAGLVNEAGIVQTKANDIINAIKTGEPKNLTSVLKPPSGGGGGGAAPKPSKEETQAQNVADIIDDVVSKTGLTAELIGALIDFASGEDISSEDISALIDMGMIATDAEGNLFMTTSGRSFVTNMKQGDLRDALDAYSRAINSMEEDEEAAPSKKVQENIDTVSTAMVDQERMTQENIDTLFAFDGGTAVPETDLAKLVDFGLMEMDNNGEIYTTQRGDQAIARFKSGDVRGAIDALMRAKQGSLNRKLSAKATRAEAATRLSEEGHITMSQADALIRAWLGKTEGSSADAIAELESMGLMEDGVLTNYGILVMKAMDNGTDDVAIEFMNDAIGSKSFVSFKSFSGGYFLTWTTNAFVDREEEVFTTKSIEDYLKETDEKGVPEGSKCDFWHIPGSEFASIVWQGGVGRFMVEVSKFDNSQVGNWFKSFFEKYPNGHPKMAPYGWGCSHEYKYIPYDRKDGVYNWFDKQKSTVLPLQEAANPFTLSEFGIGGKSLMKLSAKQKQGLQTIADEIGAPDLVEVVIKVGTQRTEVLEREGIQFKAVSVHASEDTKENLMDRNQIAVKMGELAELVSGEEEKAAISDLSEQMMEPESDVMAIYRMLMELIAELPEETRMQAEDLVTALAAFAEEPVVEEEMLVEEVEPEVEIEADAEMETEGEIELEEELGVESEEEELEEEELEEEEKAEDEEEDEDEEEALMVKSVTKSLISALQLEGLSEMLETHSVGLKGVSEAMLALAEKVEDFSARIDKLEESEKGVTEETSAEQVEAVEPKVEEKRFTPFWGNGVSVGGVAREDELSEKDSKLFSKPEVPSVIAGMRNRMLNS